MVKMILEIDGMACSMCEAHINDAVRRAFKVKKVNSSHTKRKTEIICENEIPTEELRKVIEPTGYGLLSVKCEQYDKKGIFGGRK